MSSESEIPTELGPAVRALAAGQVVFGRYELRRKLGEGGFGAVWLVYDSALREEVAFKFVLQAVAASPEAIDGLKEEAARSRRLTHPNIVRIHDFVSDAIGDAPPDLAGISMEYVDGESLAQRRLREPGKCFDVEQIAPWIDHLCEALTYAHDPKRRVIHRDLKPPNLLLSKDGELKVADFGIACSLINSITQISGRLRTGTITFMSPQQLSGKWPSESDDIYSLGATIYMLLTGTPPFHQGDIVYQVINQVPPTMQERREERRTTMRAEIPQAWEGTVAACLAKDAASRPASVAVMAERLGLGRRATPFAPAPHEVFAREPGEINASSPVVASPREVNERSDTRFPVPTVVSPQPLPGTPRLLKDGSAPRAPSPRPKHARRTWGLSAVLTLILTGACVYWFKRTPVLLQRRPLVQPLASAAPVQAKALPKLEGTPAILHPKPAVEASVSATPAPVVAIPKPEEKPALLSPPPSTPAPGQAAVERTETGLEEIRLPFPTKPNINRYVGLTGDQWGYVDGLGGVVLPAKWYFVRPFSEGLALVQTEVDSLHRKWDYIDSQGEAFPLPPDWRPRVSSYGREERSPGDFSEGRAVVGKYTGGFRYIDRQGNFVFSAEWRQADSFSEGRASVGSGSWSGEGYIDGKGKLASKLEWREARRFSEGLAAVKSPQNGKFGYIGLEGEIVIPTKWDDAHKFSQGLAAVQSNGRWGYIDRKGTRMIPLHWHRATDFANERAAVEIDGRYGYIDETGVFVIPGRFSSASQFFEGLAKVQDQDKGKYGLIDPSGKLVVPLEWSTIDLVRAADHKVYIRMARPKGISSPDAVDAPAEVRWTDSTGRVIWQSP